MRCILPCIVMSAVALVVSGCTPPVPENGASCTKGHEPSNPSCCAAGETAGTTAAPGCGVCPGTTAAALAGSSEGEWITVPPIDATASAPGVTGAIDIPVPTTFDTPGTTAAAPVTVSNTAPGVTGGIDIPMPAPYRDSPGTTASGF